MNQQIEKMVERLQKIDPYWWKWELLDVPTDAAKKILEELTKITSSKQLKTNDLLLFLKNFENSSKIT